MALGEQFTSRNVSEGPEGLTGTRVFLTTWAGRYARAGALGVPWHNARWNTIDDPRIPADDNQALWVHSIDRQPYAASSAAGSKDAATNCRIVVTYQSWPLDLTDAKNWIIEARHSVNTVDVGPRTVFATGGLRVPQRATRLIPVIEFLVTGEQRFDSTTDNAFADVWRRPPAAQMLGTVCSEKFTMPGVRYQALKTPNLTLAQMRAGHLLFASQSLSAPFHRRDWVLGDQIYRRFQRSIYWRTATDTNSHGTAVVIGGHNLLWNANGTVAGWDLTTPLLYPNTPWKNGNPGFEDWEYPVPSEILT